MQCNAARSDPKKVGHQVFPQKKVVDGQEHVDVAADLVLAVDVLLHAAEQRHRERGLDVVAAVDRRRERAEDALRDARVRGELAEVALVLLGDGQARGVVLALLDVVGLRKKSYRNGSKHALLHLSSVEPKPPDTHVRPPHLGTRGTKAT